MPSRKENSVAAGRLTPSASANKMVAPAREVPGNTAARSWASPTAAAMVQVISEPSCLPTRPPFDDEDEHAADQRRPRDRADLLGQREAGLLGEEAADAGEPEGEDQLQQVVSRAGLVQGEQRDSLMRLENAKKTASTAPAWITTLNSSDCCGSRWVFSASRR